jgi:hypothetical protein
VVTRPLWAHDAAVLDELISEPHASPAAPADPSDGERAAAAAVARAIRARKLVKPRTGVEAIVDVVLLPCQAGFALFYRPGH